MQPKDEIQELKALYELIVTSNPQDRDTLHGVLHEISEKQSEVFALLQKEGFDLPGKLDEIKMLNNQDYMRQIKPDRITPYRKTVFNTLRSISKGIRELEFNYYKSDDGCNCDLRKYMRFYFDEDSAKNLKMIKKHSDGYYDFEIYVCNDCDSKWVLLLDDGSDDGGSYWSEWNQEDHPLD